VQNRLFASGKRTKPARKRTTDDAESHWDGNIMLEFQWQGQQGLNPRPTVLETVALPAELYPYAEDGLRQAWGKVKGFSRWRGVSDSKIAG
jgi:hypothetical protein